MFNMVDYIRNLLSNLFVPTVDTRKRRAAFDEDEFPVNSKLRKTSLLMTSNNQEDWHSISNSSRRLSVLQSSSEVNKSRPRWSKENSNLSGHDDITEVSKPKQFEMDTSIKGKTFQFASSTPNNSGPRINLLHSSDDDVVFLKTVTPSNDEKKRNSLKHGLEYIPFQNGNLNKNQTSQNGSSHHLVDYNAKILKRASEMKAKYKSRNRPIAKSNALDQSFQLEDKELYKKLLSGAAPGSSRKVCDSFLSKYNTSTFFTGTGSRGKKLVELSLRNDNKKKTNFIDLTNDASTRVSTKETIKKVLSNFDNNEAIVIKDSDSDVEVLPTPPSPKRDFPIERVNSLKSVVDSSESSRYSWLQQAIQKHRNALQKTIQEIREHSDHKEKLSVVTTQVCSQRLEDQMVRCLQIKDAIIPVYVPKTVFPELSEEDQERINDAFNTRANPNEILSEKFNLSISRRDLQTLSGLSWLNDEVINFYMNLIMERGKLPQWPNTYAMNTFFYPKLIKDGHSALRRWTRRVDLFSYDLIVVPIHLRVHWCMSIIDFRNKTIQYYDSMGGANRQCLEALLKYLRDEHLDKKKAEYKVSDWTLESMSDIPQQMNGSDCGMFACTFAEFISRNSDVTFSQENMPYLRRKMVLEILNGQLLFI